MPDTPAAQHAIVYSTAWCPDCHRSLRLLNRLGVNYVEIDIEKVDGADRAMRRLNGGSGKVPTVIVGTTVLVEPSDTDLEAALKAE